MTDIYYIVERDFGKLGREWTGTSEDTRRAVLHDIYRGDIEDVLKVLEIDEEAGTCRNVTEDFARELLDRAVAEDFGQIPEHLIEFIETHCGCRAVADATREYARA